MSASVKVGLATKTVQLSIADFVAVLCDHTIDHGSVDDASIVSGEQHGNRLWNEGISSITRVARWPAIVILLVAHVLNNSYAESSFVRNAELTLLPTNLAHFPHESSNIDLGRDGGGVIQCGPSLAIFCKWVCAGSH